LGPIVRVGPWGPIVRVGPSSAALSDYIVRDIATDSGDAAEGSGELPPTERGCDDEQVVDQAPERRLALVVGRAQHRRWMDRGQGRPEV
jgi:hypothetical protein